jgi:hypothetical protein
LPLLYLAGFSPQVFLPRIFNIITNRHINNKRIIMYTFLFLFRSLYMYKQLCTIENRLPSDSIFYLPTVSSTFRQYLLPSDSIFYLPTVSSTFRQNLLPSDSIFYLPTVSSTFRQYLQPSDRIVYLPTVSSTFRQYQPHERVNSMLSFVQGRKVPENLILAITG